MDGYKAQADLHDRYSLYKVEKNRKSARARANENVAPRTNFEMRPSSGAAAKHRTRRAFNSSLAEMSSSALIMRHFTQI